MNIKVEKPLLRGHFHQAMFFVALGACSLLIAKSETRLEYISTGVYSLGLLMMFGISALYHRINWPAKKRALMKRFDHSAIYIMIAGTFTPVTLLALSPEEGSRLLITIWIVAAIGVIQSIFFVNLPKKVSSILYLVAGYLIAPYLGDLLPTLGPVNLALLIAGGVVYSLGAIAYGFKRPLLNPRIFSYHEVFHSLVSVAAVLHFMVIHSLILRA